MKRSEMVNYLHKLLETFEGCKLDKAACDEILEGLENMGMRPPPRETYVFTDLVGNQIGELNDVYEWEPEKKKGGKREKK